MMKKRVTLKRKACAEATKSGFTIVEFTLATAFIAVLLITVAIITSNIIAIYQKGLTLKAVNSVGRSLSDEFTEAINMAPSVDTTSLCNSHLSDNTYRTTCKGDKANHYIYQQIMARRTTTENANGGSIDDGKNSYDVQTGGVFCTGEYSYIWNTYYAEELAKANLSGHNYLTIKYYQSAADASMKNATTLQTPFRLIKIKDPTYRVCSAVTKPNYQACLDDPYDNMVNVSSGCQLSSSNMTDERGAVISKAYAIDLTTLANGRDNIVSTIETGFLSSFDLDLQLYEFAIFPIAQDDVTLRTFMSGTFVLATERGNINLTRSGNYCDVNKRTDTEDSSNILDVGSEFNYCAINKFNFAARTAGM